MGWIDITNTFITVYGYPLSYVEFVGTFTGLISVWFAARSNIWTWPIGLINVVCFFLIFFQVQLYADMFLQIYFFITSIYGWIIWYNKKGEGNIEWLNNKTRVTMLAIIISSTIVLGLVVKNIHLLLPSVFSKQASYPFPDAFVATLSIVATILLAKKKTENWILWIIADVISVGLYAKKSVMFITIEYVIFLCLASVGLITWGKIMQNENRTCIR
jgi:nicotinamide mononucleotide transporter